MHEPTIDPDIVIESRTLEPPSVVYLSVSSGARWRVSGECNLCGLCAIGAQPPERYRWDGPPGTPNSCYDLEAPHRLDEPCAPGFDEDMRAMAAATETATVGGCALTIEVLGGGGGE